MEWLSWFETEETRWLVCDASWFLCSRSSSFDPLPGSGSHGWHRDFRNELRDWNGEKLYFSAGWNKITLHSDSHDVFQIQTTYKPTMIETDPCRFKVSDSHSGIKNVRSCSGTESLLRLSRLPDPSEEPAMRKRRLCVKISPRVAAQMALCDIQIVSKSKYHLVNYTCIGWAAPEIVMQWGSEVSRASSLIPPSPPYLHTGR